MKVAIYNFDILQITSRFRGLYSVPGRSRRGYWVTSLHSTETFIQDISNQTPLLANAEVRENQTKFQVAEH